MMSSLLILCLVGSAAGQVDLTSGGDNSCYVEGEAIKYRGLATTTVSGRTCQKWSGDHPWAANAISATPENGLGNNNFCRAPDDSFDRPWCFTMDTNPDKEKEACNVPVCKAEGAFARDFHAEASDLKTAVSAHDCECASQLFGATTTTADTSVGLVQMGKSKRTGKPCLCTRK